MNEMIQMMWTGPHLPKLQRVCLNSFIRNGHPIELYAYDGCDYACDGLTILDATTILPKDKVFVPKVGLGAGNLSTFSDLFRYTLLAKKGGWWVDTDTYCLRPFKYAREHLLTFDAQQFHWLVTTPFKTTAGHPVIQHILSIADAVPRDKIVFNEMGSKLLNGNILQYRDMLRYTEAFEVFQPWDYKTTETWITAPNFPAVNIATKAIHLFNEIWRRRQLSTDGDFRIFGGLNDLTCRVEDQDKAWDRQYPRKPIQPITGVFEEDVTMVVKAFNRPSALIKMLQSIRRYYPTVQILIADDGQIKLPLSAWKDERTVTFHLPFNSGLSAGRNFLVDRVHTPFTLLLDDDYVFNATTNLHRLYDVLMNNADVALAGGAAECRWQPGFIYVGLLELKGSELHMTSGIREQRKDCVIVDFMPNFYLARTAALQDVRWDDHIKICYEHPDFFLRLQGRYKAAFCDDVRIGHEPMVSNPAYDKYRSQDQKNYLRYLMDKWRIKKFYNRNIEIVYPEDTAVAVTAAQARQNLGLRPRQNLGLRPRPSRLLTRIKPKDQISLVERLLREQQNKAR